jgi:hypothetical protein
LKLSAELEADSMVPWLVGRRSSWARFSSAPVRLPPQAEDLDEAVDLTGDLDLVFIKLVPLVGG